MASGIPGVRRSHTAKVASGVTSRGAKPVPPVVPMWLPEGYELAELGIEQHPASTRVHSRFKNVEDSIVFFVDIYSEDVARMYQKDEDVVDSYECGGIVHQIFKNNDILTAVWSRNRTEVSLSMNCQEDMMHRILKSIYSTEDD